MLSVVDSSDQHREKMLAVIEETIATFKSESAIFDAKLFASTIVQAAFFDDTERQFELLTKLLASHRLRMEGWRQRRLCPKTKNPSK